MTTELSQAIEKQAVFYRTRKTCRRLFRLLGGAVRRL
jgi:hypothetical protein